MADIRSNRGLGKDTHRDLGFGGLRAELEIGVTQALSNRIHANESAGRQEVLALEGPRTHGVLLSIDAVLVGREELNRGKLVTRVAAGRRLGRADRAPGAIGALADGIADG